MRDSQRNFLNERQKTRDAKLREIQRQEQRADPSSPFNWYRHASEDARANRMADAENQRKLAEQALINEGQFAVEDRRQMGGTARTNLEQAGLNQRFGDELGFKERESGRRFSLDTGRLEYGRGKWNSECRSEIRRYSEEHQWRRRLSGPILTLRCESVGSKQD